MKLACNILGGAMIAVGVLWIVQGLHILPGQVLIPPLKLSGMSWAGNGSWLAALGAGVLVGNNRASNKT